MIVIIDNFDSFTYNIYQYVCELSTEECRVFRNNAISVDDVLALEPSLIILSPGPGTPEDGGISLELVRRISGKIPLFGVCLGHQIIAAAHGARIVHAKDVLHGKTDVISIDGCGVFRNIPNRITVMRYHSLLVDPATLADSFEITARSSTDEIMGIRHRNSGTKGFAYIEGVQFHPESIATAEGKALIKNALHYKRDAFQARRLLTDLMGDQEPQGEDVQSFIEELTEGALNDTIATGIIASFGQGPSAATLARMAKTLRAQAPLIQSTHPLLDTCGTGGDSSSTYNISSLVALLATACGAHVAKHGNRAVSSRSGSADFYDALGVPIQLAKEDAERCLAETGFCFLFAPLYHSGLRFAAPIRKTLGVKTLFNILGPLCNPANANFQLIGVYDDSLRTTVAEAALLLGVERVLVVHSGIDEISVSGITKASLGEQGQITELTIDPRTYGISYHPKEALITPSPEENINASLAFLSGDATNPALRDAVLLNTAAALFVARICPDIAEGLNLARHHWESGKALEIVESLRAWKPS